MNENQVTKEKISMAEAMRLKRKLELDIYELLDEFRKKTTLTPSRVVLSFMTFSSLASPEERRVAKVEIEACL